jgi:hypothetical protein
MDPFPARIDGIRTHEVHACGAGISSIKKRFFPSYDLLINKYLFTLEGRRDDDTMLVF